MVPYLSPSCLKVVRNLFQDVWKWLSQTRFKYWPCQEPCILAVAIMPLCSLVIVDRSDLSMLMHIIFIPLLLKGAGDIFKAFKLPI